ncbi:LPS O-antigen subunit length determinant protein (WzzB/FepE family) [Pullulanibacillus pueri]|uniref:Uncharacterized protein n=1 Tax=Pullulanibacillus pueri TaxID=1437324 RepID=A0A8J2ZX78_9BACL|nr:LPS O-antigen subunit length determinant protein (WzzB/FepE family) [Pullulanibacillus pueri]GGH83294.1 hypothetical protein GCM10007096_23950 [Pullulanibacillus pueri]
MQDETFNKVADEEQTADDQTYSLGEDFFEARVAKENRHHVSGLGQKLYNEARYAWGFA